MNATTPKTAAQMVAEAKSRIDNITPAQLAAELEQGEAVLVDLREPEERTANGVIPGAIHAPRGCSSSTPIPRAPTTGPSSILSSGSSCIALPAAVPRWPATCSRPWVTAEPPTSTEVSKPGRNRAWRSRKSDPAATLAASCYGSLAGRSRSAVGGAALAGGRSAGGRGRAGTDPRRGRRRQDGAGPGRGRGEGAVAARGPLHRNARAGLRSDCGRPPLGDAGWPSRHRECGPSKRPSRDPAGAGPARKAGRSRPGHHP